MMLWFFEWIYAGQQCLGWLPIPPTTGECLVVLLDIPTTFQGHWQRVQPAGSFPLPLSHHSQDHGSSPFYLGVCPGTGTTHFRGSVWGQLWLQALTWPLDWPLEWALRLTSRVGPRSDFCSGCGLVTFPYVCCQASQGHFGGFQFQSPRLSGRWPIGPPHRIAVGLIQPTLLHEHLDLWLQWSTSASATEPTGRRVYPV